MAIQHRRGIYNRFDPTRLVAGEWAIVLSGDTSAKDGMAAYICFAAGTVKRVATFEDMAENIAAANEQLIEQLTEELSGNCADAADRANAAAQAAEDGEGGRIAAENARATAESTRIANESARVSAETARATAESGRSSAETARATAETSRAAAEDTRVSDEADRASAEQARATAEQTRTDNESGRVAAETVRVQNEQGRVTAENGRVTAENGRVVAEAARAAAFAIIEQKIATRFRYTCGEGEYDPSTREPIIAVPDPLTRYFVPSAHPTAEDQWVEWEWDEDGERWEKIGTTEATFSPITIEQINSIVSGTSVTGNEVLNTTDLSYLYTLITAAFSPTGHTHAAGEIASGVFDVPQGGTGMTMHTTNSVLVGNGSGSLKNISSAKGALYATGANEEPQFGTLPIAEGGTGATSASAALTSLGAAAATHDHSGHALTPASVTATGAIQGSSISDGTGTLAQLRDSVSQTFRFTKLNSSRITIPSGQSVSLPDRYTSATMALICGYGYDGMRFTHLGNAGSINVPVAETASTIGKIGFNVSTGMITNATSITVTIMDVYAVTVNG